MFKSLQWYLGRLFLKIFLFLIVITSIIVTVFEVLDVLRQSMGNPNYTNKVILLLAVLRIPRRLYLLSPYLIFGSSIFFFLRLRSTNELYALGYMGLRPLNYLGKMVVFILFLFALETALVNPLVAFCERSIALIKSMVEKNRDANFNVSISQTGIWLRDKINTHTFLFIHAKSMNKKTDLFNKVSALEIDAEGNVNKFLNAQYVTLNQGFWTFHNVTDLNRLKPVPNIKIQTILKPSNIETISKFEEYIPFYEIKNKIVILKKLGLSSLHYQFSFHQILCKILFWIGFLILGYVLIIYIRQNFIIFLYALTISLVLFFITEMIQAFILSEKINPIPGLWIPPIAFLSIVFMLSYFKSQRQ